MKKIFLFVACILFHATAVFSQAIDTVHAKHSSGTKPKKASTKPKKNPQTVPSTKYISLSCSKSYCCTTSFLRHPYAGLIEIAKGHFVPKGIVSTSQYILDNNNKLLFKNEIIQEYGYKIFQGTVSKEEVNMLISVDESTLCQVITNLMPILSTGLQAIEFGLLKNDTTQSLEPYLIDLVDDNSPSELSSKLISEGVLSMGIRCGKIKFIDVDALACNSLELHFHNQFENNYMSDDEIIFIAETPDIALLEILKQHNNTKIGFIFNEGSVLSHFSIILRERQIPAIIIGQKMKSEAFSQVKIDASTPNLIGINRVSMI